MDIGNKVAIGLFLLGILTWLADLLFGEDIKKVSRHARIWVFLLGLTLVIAGVMALWWWPSPQQEKQAALPPPMVTHKTAPPAVPQVSQPSAPPHRVLPNREFETPTINPRQKYIIGLQRLYAEGTDVIRHLSAATTDAGEEKQTEHLWIWTTHVGLWTCRNMGAPAMTKAIPLNPGEYLSSIHPVPSSSQLEIKREIGIAMVSRIQANLSDLVEHNSWDPIGKPILPEGGCEAAVGKATDKPAPGDPLPNEPNPLSIPTTAPPSCVANSTNQSGGVTTCGDIGTVNQGANPHEE